jgi:thioredoxin-related protein
MFTTLAGSVLLLATSASAAPAGEAWHADFDAATAVAKQEGKDLLVDFTGSDWCGWCVRLHREVFGHEEFTAEAGKKFVLVALDFPSSEELRAKVPNPARNEELQKRYEVQGFPTVLLMNVEGEVYASTGYRDGGVTSYLAHLDEIGTSGRKALGETKALVKAFEEAKGEEKLAVWERVMTLFTSLDGSSPFLAQLAGPVRYALEIDPKNERGLKLRAVEALVKAGQVDEPTLAACRELDPKNERGLLERVVDSMFQGVEDEKTAREALGALDGLLTHGFRDKEVGFRLCFIAAGWCAGPLEDLGRAKGYALKAKEIGTDEEEILEMLEELLGQ